MTNLLINVFKKRFPLTRIIETIIVMILRGAILSMMLSAIDINVARNCFVTSSPKSVRRGAKLVKAFLPKLSALTVIAIMSKQEFVRLVHFALN
jgi:hypothetical protein